MIGFGLHNRKSCLDVLEPQLASLAQVDGWKGLDLGGIGGTDHLSFFSAGRAGLRVPAGHGQYRLTHHTQSDTFDKAKEPSLIQGAQVMSVTVMRVANLPELLRGSEKTKQPQMDTDETQIKRKMIVLVDPCFIRVHIRGYSFLLSL